MFAGEKLYTWRESWILGGVYKAKVQHGMQQFTKLMMILMRILIMAIIIITYI